MMFVGMVAVVARGNFDVGGFTRVWNATQQSGRDEFFKYELSPFQYTNIIYKYKYC